MKKVLIIFKHEFKQVTKGKLYIIMTILGPILFGALMILPSYFAIKSSEAEDNASIAVVYNNPEYKELNNIFTDNGLNPVEVSSIEEGNTLIGEEEVKGVVVIPEDLLGVKVIDYYSSTGTDQQYSDLINDALDEYILDLKRKSLNLSVSDSEWLSETVWIKANKLSSDGEINDSNYVTVLITGTVIAFLIVMTSLIYGLMVARSALTEKSSKTVEILISSVKPYKILIGKVLGISAAALIQFGTWLLLALVAVKFVVPFIDEDLNINIFTPSVAVIIFIMFVLGIFLFMFIYAGLGANLENEQQLGQFQMPIQLLLMSPIIVSSSIISNPDGTIAKVMSYIPFTSPSVMSIRMLINKPDNLSIFLSISILAITLIFVLIGGARLFKAGIVTKGSKKSIIDLIKIFFS